MGVQKYELELSIKNDNVFAQFSSKSKYKSSGGTEDLITISHNKISIQGLRSYNNVNSIFNKICLNFTKKENSTLYKQLNKSIPLFLVLNGKSANIESIRLSQIENGIVKTKTWGNREVKQILNADQDLAPLKDIKASEICKILDEDERSRRLLISVTYFLRSFQASSQQGRFESLWKAFNALYRLKCNKKTDHDCHVDLRAYIGRNLSKFPFAIRKASCISIEDIRSNTRWVKMIHNNYPTQENSSSFRDSILRNKDARIAEVYRQTLPVREKFLKISNDYTKVKKHLDNIISKNAIDNADVLSTIIFRYGYFLRNKLVHAERSDSSFTLFSNTENDAEMNWVSNLLESLIIDLFNDCKSYI